MPCALTPTSTLRYPPEGDSLILKQYFISVLPVIRRTAWWCPWYAMSIARMSWISPATWQNSRPKHANASSRSKRCRAVAFTVSSLGGIGGTMFHAYYQLPGSRYPGSFAFIHAAGLHATSKSFEPRLILPLSLSYDHRVIDGADARASPATCA